MSSIDLKTLSIEKARKMLDVGEITAVDLTNAYLEEIKNKNNDINAYLEIYDDVLKQAEEADKKIKAGDKSALLGIPLAIKDNLAIDGKKVSAASKILEGYVASYDATAIEKLKKAGAIFLGRTNLDEFAMGASTENSAYGVTKNPHNTTRVAGGSSGGSAAAVAMNGALGALGSDTGGSVRQPASFCGVVGFKPTYGAISRYGLLALASSLDVIGTMGKSVADAEIIFNVMKGTDPMDSTSFYPPYQERYGASPHELVKTVGVIEGLEDWKGVSPEVKENYLNTISKLKKQGYEIKEIEIPYISLSLAVYYIILPAEASSNLARYDGMKYGALKEGKDLLGDYVETRGRGFGREVRRRIILGTYVLSSGYNDQYYNKANKVRQVLRNDFEEAFKKVDVIITPTTPTPAFKIGAKGGDPVAMYLEDIFTVSANLNHCPAISVPSGFVKIDGKDLPIGIQFIAPHYKEDRLFEIGKIIEKLR